MVVPLHRRGNKSGDQQRPLAFSQFIKQRPYILILGPSNSGKTSLFVELFRGKKKAAIISVLARKHLCPPETTPAKFFGDVMVQSPTRKLASGIEGILIDEIHCFSPDEMDVMAARLQAEAPQAELFISMLPGSYTQDPLPNTYNLLACADRVLALDGACIGCARPTSRSHKLEQQQQPSEESGTAAAGAESQIIVGKKKFNALCARCKQQRDISRRRRPNRRYTWTPAF